MITVTDESLVFTAGDTGKDLSGICLDDDAPADLTGATSIKVNIARPGLAPLSKDGVAVGSPTLGVWKIDWLDTDLVNPGPEWVTYRVEVRVRFASTELQTFGEDTFVVRPAIAGGGA
jgi:hypothetical protein